LESIEIEVKIKPKASPKYIKEKLSSHGSIFLYKVLEKDVYWQHPCRDFVKTDEALRTRVMIKDEGVEECILTYKGPRQKSVFKKREEIEVHADNCVKLGKLLEQLGFVKVATIVKDREYYRLDNCLVSLDLVKDLGFFVEIECSERDIERVLRALDIDYIVVEETYLELMLKKAKKKANTI